MSFEAPSASSALLASPSSPKSHFYVLPLCLRRMPMSIGKELRTLASLTGQFEERSSFDVEVLEILKIDKSQVESRREEFGGSV